jgi:molybdate transport system permease protein
VRHLARAWAIGITCRPVTSFPTLSALRVPCPRLGMLARIFMSAAVAAAPAASQEQPSGELLVLAASSLADVLPAVADAWSGETGGARVRFSFDATSRLAPQALRGAPGDVFFSADWTWMDWLEARGGVDPSSVRDFLGNELVLVVPAGGTAPASPGELAAVGRLALAGENVPAGRYARDALEAVGMWARIEERVVRGGSVRGTLEWVARGEVDAAVVYRTDALTEDDVAVTFGFPAASHRPVRYPAGVLTGSRLPDLAREFLEFSAGPRGREIFEQAGFSVEGSPSATEASPAVGTAVPRVSSAIRISVLVATLATLAGLPLAVGLGFVLARRDFAGKTLVSTVSLAPLVVPPVVTGFLLLSLLGSGSPVGRWLAAAGLPVPFTLVGATLAALVVGFPLYVLSVRNAFEAVDPQYEELSWTLGVPPRRTFLRVSLPLALPGIAAGALLAFARALGEFGATVVLAGNVEGSTRTIALAVYTLLETPGGDRVTWILVGASVALSLAALVGFEALARRQRRRMEVHGGG